MRVLTAVAALAAQASAADRAVSFWYAPSKNDMNDTLMVLSKNRAAVTSVMLTCGHQVDNTGALVGTTSPLCDDGAGGGMIPALKAIGIKPELWLEDGSTNATAHKIWFANATAQAAALTAIGKKHGVYGWNLDLEPQKVPGTAADGKLYAAACTTLKAALNKEGMRLTVDVAQWSAMLNDFSVLAPAVDRLMNMETYNANSMWGWTHGDLYGGFYDKFVNSKVPIEKCAPGIGSWPTAKCGSSPCWTTTAASVAPRMQQMIKDGVPEISLFRLYGPQGNSTPGDQRWPEDFWWAPLHQYMSGN
eukprot:TRINITY_DN36444_c0_g1_i1.p1 TRINITY_DN36444_c0_g1~~TRINITY_DN36444_c0_g1_i1.p1  ORF type:complete len:325 (+),score=125.91 TRINITY_DN36444_c0_g1_i1:65-976(+)